MSLLPHSGKNQGRAHSLQTGQLTPKSNFFCQQNLTKAPFSLENRDTYKFSLFMENKKGAALGAMMLGALTAEPALAEDKSGKIQLAQVTGSISRQAETATDCVAFVKEQRDAAKDVGMSLSRKEQKLLLLDCRGGKLESRIAEQEKVIAALNANIAAINLEIDENNQIIDADGRAIGQIIAIKDQWVIQSNLNEQIETDQARTETAQAETQSIQNERKAIQAEIRASQERQRQALEEADRILRSLLTS